MRGLWALETVLLNLSIHRAVLNTIFFFVLSCLTYFLLTLHKRSIWPEFKFVTRAAILLSTWYFLNSVNLWMHQQLAAVPYGYILTLPIWAVFRVVSVILTLWGGHAVVWRELHPKLHDFRNPRLNQKRLWGHRRREPTVSSQRIWGHIGSGFVLFLFLTGAYYVVLFLTTAIVWLYAAHPNVIADIATKRNGFEMAFTAFAFVFSILILAGALASAVFARMYDRHLPLQRQILLAATIALFGRSLSELVVVLSYNQQTGPTQADVALPREICFGVFNMLFLAAMWYLARYVTGGKTGDSGASGAGRRPRGDKSIFAGLWDMSDSRRRAAEVEIRTTILQHLHNVTDDHRIAPPKLGTVIEEWHQALRRQLEQHNLQIQQQQADAAAEDGPVVPSAGVDDLAFKIQVQEEFLERLKDEYRDFEPIQGRLGPIGSV